MTYSTDIAGRNNAIGFYVDFDGIAAKLATHPFGSAPWSLSGTYHAAIEVGSLQGSGSRLDRDRSMVLPGGFSLRVLATDDVSSYLRRRGGTETTLNAAAKYITPSGTSVTLSTGTNTYANGSTVYLDRETITLGTHAGGGIYGGCTRGAEGSQAVHHRNGSIISDVPRFWQGRRAVLYAVHLDTGNTQAIRAGVLNRSPSFVDGAWELEFVDVSRELRRPIYSGFAPSKVLDVTSSLGNGEVSATLEVDPTVLADGSATEGAHVRLDYPEGVFEVYAIGDGDVDDTNKTLSLTLADRIYPPPSLSSQGLTGEPADVEVRQAVYVTGDPAVVALQFILSDTGDGTNHSTYDVLPGKHDSTSTAGVDHPPRRSGAAIPSAWVDVTAWEALIGVSPAIKVYVDEQMPLFEFLHAEIAWRLGGYVYITTAGLISFKRWELALPSASLTTITGDDYDAGHADTVDDESAAISYATLECNYDFGTREFLKRIAVAWRDVAAIYGDNARELSIKTRSTWVGSAPPHDLATPPYENEIAFLLSLDRLYARVSNGVRRIRRTFPWSQHLTLVPSSTFAFTDTRIPDHEGGTGVTARRYEVVSEDPDYEAGTVTIEAEEMPSGSLVAPSFIIGSVASGTIFTIDQSGDEADLFDADPGLDFPDNCDVRIYDASASPPFSASEVESCVSQASGSITINTTPGSFTVAAGDLVVLEESANTGNTNADGADVRDHLNVGTTYTTELA